MDRALLARLTGGEGAGLLASLPPYDESQAMALSLRLRGEGFDPDLIAAALTQSRLRARGAAKFGARAAEMFFTDDGLEQATRPRVATGHAARFIDAGARTVHDLGCGIGSDAMAFAEAGLQVAAVDADDPTAAVAEANLRPWPSARVTCSRAEDVTVACSRQIGIWLDPARRTPGIADVNGRTRRTFRLDRLEPSWEFVVDAARRASMAGVKLSPALPFAAIPLGAEAQWTSYRGEVVEAACWFGATVQTVGRTAQVITRDGSYRITEADADGERALATRLSDLRSNLYEADRAVVRAGLTGALMRTVDGLELEGGLGYVTSHQDVTVPWARRYVVHEAMPYNIKAIRAWMRDHRIGRLTIKKRGVTTDETGLRRQLRLAGDRSATVLLTRLGGAQVVLILTTRERHSE